MQQALSTLRKELKAFAHAGLRNLRADIVAGREHARLIPARGTWKGCPLSYRVGSRGSCDRDSTGYTCNAFTEMWDGEGDSYFDEMDLLREVERELNRREQKKRKRQAAEAA